MKRSSGFDRFQHHWPGYRDVLRSAKVRADLQVRANAVLSAAQSRLAVAGNEGHGVHLIADTNVGRNRAGATIIGVPLHLERHHRILGSAIGVSGAVGGSPTKRRSTRARDAHGRFI